MNTIVVHLAVAGFYFGGIRLPIHYSECAVASTNVPTMHAYPFSHTVFLTDTRSKWYSG